MIGFLSGKFMGWIAGQGLVRLPSGVGYLVTLPPTGNYLVNENLDIYILEVQRENKSDLYAFNSMRDREWVEKLTRVDGVGPKTAAMIIYTLGWETVAESVMKGDVNALSAVKGLGVKTAKKIVLELKGAQTDLEGLDRTGRNSQSMSHFTETLGNLGYKRGEIVGLITTLKKDGLWQEDNLVEMVKLGLRYLAKK